MNKQKQAHPAFVACIVSHWDAVLLTTLMSLVYMACAIVPYAFWDDYAQMQFIAFHWTDWKTNGLAVDGRPLASWLIFHGFATAGALTNLYLLRMVAFVGAISLGLYVQYALKKLNFSRNEAFIYATLSVLTPGMGEFVGWTVSWPYPFGILFIAWLSVRITKVAESATPAKRFAAFVAICVAIQVVLLTYQPLAGFLLVIPFLMLTKGRVRPLVAAAGLLTFSFAFYRFAVFPTLHLFSPRMGTTGRVSIAGDLPAHLIDITKRFLPFCGSSWASLILPESASNAFGWFVVALAAAGVFFLARKWKGWRGAGVIVLTLYTVALSAPQVFVLDDVWAFRTHYAMSVIVGVAGWVGLSTLLRPAERVWAEKCGVLALFLAAAWCVNVGIVYSATREYGLVKDTLREIRASGIEKAYVTVAPDAYEVQPPVPIKTRSCYGYISLILMRGDEVHSVVREEWAGWKTRPEIVFVPADRPDEVPANGRVFDLWGKIMGTVSPAASL